jgi:hypothetical protein
MVQIGHLGPPEDFCGPFLHLGQDVDSPLSNLNGPCSGCYRSLISSLLVKRRPQLSQRHTHMNLPLHQSLHCLGQSFQFHLMEC